MYLVDIVILKKFKRSMFLGFKRSRTSGYYGTKIQGLLKRRYRHLNKKCGFVWIMSKNNPNRRKLIKELNKKHEI